ncbi:oxidoreductase [Rhodococcus rhodochrous]|uniref:zinc-binding dehydrogenase n=1 Tax=Rhodococcus rhodochrous TaxID=1829 RepID=UPI000D0500B7|nr:zinc-binding dehydrogenase [Rhodococcus rhodochrous]AYA23407.1 oxidoreductase [Rhodococcus rhodochrous]
MQAVIVHQWGGPEQLTVETIDDPTPMPGHAIVELKASAINWHDILVRRSGRGFPLPRILGIDGAGIRRDTGEEVVIYPGLNWGTNTAAPSPQFSILGDHVDGTYAELVRVPTENLYPKPAYLSWEEAAALPVGALTAYRAIITRAGLRPGETVLVLGAGSGVSTFSVMIASVLGATVWVTSSSTEKIQRVCELGAAGGVLYTNPDWPQHIIEETGGVDVVVDGVGANLEQSLACLKPGGRVVVFGATAGTTGSIDIPSLYFGQHTILGSTLGTEEEFAGMLTLSESHRLRPVIDSTRPLSDARAAHERIESRGHFGKLVLSAT